MSAPPTLMFHAVDTRADPYRVQVTPARLREHLQTLRRLGLRGVSMRELLDPRREDRAVGLTFDDGYADFAVQALPVLAEFGFTATVFVVTGNLGGANDWDGGPARPLMDVDQVKAVHGAGHEIGSHGVHHVRLPDLRHDQVEEELVRSRARLEEILSSPVQGFCYPYGALDTNTVAAARAVYDYACAVWAGPAADRWSIPRIHVGQQDGRVRLVSKLAVRHVRERLQSARR